MPEHLWAPVSYIPALQTTNLNAWQGKVHALKDINLSIPAGRITAFFGEPGSGHDMLLRAIMGFVPTRSGSVRIHGTEAISHTPDQIRHLGVAYCSSNTGVFASLSCEENLLLTPNSENTLGGGMSLAEIYELLPNLYPRRHMPCTRLSSNEQQVLAMARVLRTGANLVLLDNIGSGLTGAVVKDLIRLMTQLRSLGYTLILQESNTDLTGALADSCFTVQDGQLISHPA